MPTTKRKPRTPSLYEYPMQPSGTNAHLAPPNRNELHATLLDTSADAKSTARTLRGAMLARATGSEYAPSEAMLQTWQSEHRRCIAAYNEAVRAWHAAWQPWRDAERVRRAQVRAQLQAERQAAHRANLRAQACGTCGLIHRGEC